MKQQILNFIESKLNEAEYYSLPKENLLTLKEYLLVLEEKDKEFKIAIQDIERDLKSKYDWIEGIEFNAMQTDTGEYIISTIYLNAYDGVGLTISLDKTINQYLDAAKKIPHIYRIIKNVRTRIKRQDIIPLIQKELHQIDEIGKTIYDGLLYTKSISNNFDIRYLPSLGGYVSYERDTLANYFSKTIRFSDKEELTSIQKDKLLEKVLIKKKDK